MRAAIGRDFKDKRTKEATPLYIARNKFAFHYSTDDAINACIKPDNIPNEFILYLADKVGSSMNFGSEECVSNALLDLVTTKRKSKRVSLDRLMQLTFNRASWSLDVYGDSLAALAMKYLGTNSKELNIEEIQLATVPAFEEISLPWFVQSPKD